MYLKYYKLTNRPFQINTDSTMLWLGEKHKEALATLKYGVYENKGFLLLTGDIGTGKTTLINALKENLGKNVICSTISNPGMERLDFLNYIADAFHIKKRFKSKGEFLIYFTHFLKKARENKKRVLLIVDESQKLTQELLDEIRLLSNIEVPNSKLINIFFIGQNEFNDIINKEENTAVKQRITINYNLKPLTKKETYKYIQHRLKISGSETQIFKNEAIDNIYRFSNGIPRKINILCDHALLTGYVKGKKKINKTIIEECINEIEIHRSDNQKNTIKDDISPKKRRSFSKAALYLSVFMIVWSIIGFFYYNKDGYSFDNLGKYWTRNINEIRNKIFPEMSTNADKIEIKKEKSQIKDNETDRNQIQVKNIEPIKNNHIQHTDKEEQNKGTNLKERLERLDKSQEEKPAVMLVSADARSIAENRSDSAVDAVTDTFETKQSDAIKLNSVIIEKNRSIQDELSIENKKTKGEDIGETFVAKDTPVDRVEPFNKGFTIYFDYNSNQLNSDGTRVINDIVEIMKVHNNARLVVKGHTDNAGTYDTNITLSQKRANIVKKYLVKEGIQNDRIDTMAKGDTEPIESNDTVTGRRINRRVEIEIIN